MAASQPMKRLIVCCDGTWLNSSNGVATDFLNPVKAISNELTGKISLQTPSNVTRIGRCIKQLGTAPTTGSQPVQQITYYQAGIGSQDLEDKIIGGATGYGLAEHIREAYQFIAANFNVLAQDEIFLIGFSRGAFTARSIAAFINDVGLLTMTGMLHFYPIFADWENQQKKGWKPPFDNDPFPGPRPNLFDEKKKYVDKLVSLGMTTPNVSIKAVAVWDTVGSLGFPRLGIFNPNNQESLDYAFVDTTVPPMVEHAIHAVSLDEDRKVFSPTIWELPNPQPGQTLNQVWFAGAHADVGGSYDDTRAADITLAWMVSQLEKYISFDRDLLKKQFYKPQGTEPEVPWSCGTIHDELNAFYKLGGAITRTPDEYVRYDHYTGEPRVPKEPLSHTFEKVHSSVRVRWGLKGKNASGGDYSSKALKSWTLQGTAAAMTDNAQVSLKQIQEGQQQIQWRKPAPGGGDFVMPEDVMSDLEFDLMRSITPSLEAKFLSIALGT
ncbi:hypothetical protein K432DRAFT_356252 [Lepidopterella palustris CBS 459.81]|uniref:T6SS Phospholipase effector Tle1-like catalytic domain-containing protein n=1 Tax=Lepidopterella palustris CBS 459.81 TaxID=1314670 RepID=A0A8E2E7C5_9PEZI|nr:hypothetical protein K432DRAFT_356252 [Lepidopterella palustris CBS 459.81]